MEAKFRPIPITILDILAVVIPGGVWSFLFITSYFVFNQKLTDQIPLVQAWNTIESAIGTLSQKSSWLAPLLLLFVSAMTGYMLKPFAMEPATKISMLLMKRDKDIKDIPLRELKFPFDAIFREQDYYKIVYKRLEDIIHCPPDKLYGSKMFILSKRYLRLVAPSLWEENERQEAEVRMTGELLLAAVFSALLSFLTLIARLRTLNWMAAFIWLVLSILMILFLAANFKRIRIREVAYGYMSALVVLGYTASTAPQEMKPTPEEV